MVDFSSAVSFCGHGWILELGLLNIDTIELFIAIHDDCSLNYESSLFEFEFELLQFALL